jgi:prepilin-type N-terminal cleavage/methylation domain-containing protein/prepilin-type processing-associated H-X9-DG protein
LNPSQTSRRAFTLVELLAVMAVLALLACLCLPAFARVRSQTTRAQCAANLKQFTLAFEIYGAEHNALLPQVTGGYWPWDMPANFSSLLSPYGAQRQQMYCPANPGQNVDGLWNYDGIRVIGYAMTLGAAGVLPNDQNSTIAATVRTNTSVPGNIVFVVKPSQRVLLADATISMPGQNNPKQAASYQWINIAGGYTAPGFTGHRTSHLNSTLPAGGNLGMLDGHVEWRSFTNMTVHTPIAVSGLPIPSFWW